MASKKYSLKCLGHERFSLLIATGIFAHCCTDASPGKIRLRVCLDTCDLVARELFVGF